MVLLLGIYLVGLYGRAVPFVRTEPPAFFASEAEGIPIGLAGCWPETGVHQFSDGATVETVIRLTGAAVALEALPAPYGEMVLEPGEILAARCLEGKITEITRDWLPAGQRVALGVPLHPDRMKEADWEVLPGIGPRLAQTIEENRQKNGDFGDLEALERVQGIGKARIRAWRRYF